MKKILLAEDNDLNARLLTSLMRVEGYSSCIVRDVEEAVELFSNSVSNEFSAVLFDVQNPWSDCWAASEKIRNLDRDDSRSVKIYICTGTDFVRSFAEDIDVNGILRIPLDPEELLSYLKRDIGNGTE